MARKLKVYEMGDTYYGTTQPQIRLQGKWLRQAGFLPNDQIVVRQEGERLVIERQVVPGVHYEQMGLPC
ncbi:SymE family type I addiction module toxin [Chloroflexota bacterium]